MNNVIAYICMALGNKMGASHWISGLPVLALEYPGRCKLIALSHEEYLHANVRRVPILFAA
jgi:hypothetical protein